MTWQPLAGKSAVVTGGASGIGLAIVRTLAESGARGTVIDVHAAEASRRLDVGRGRRPR